ncbi:MAG: ABC transporter substrate-binding protein [Fimbriiglobus sp.]
MLLRSGLFLILASLFVSISAGRDEEEEAKPKGPVKKVPVPDDDKKPAPMPPPLGKLPGLDPTMPSAPMPREPGKIPGLDPSMPPPGNLTPPLTTPPTEPEKPETPSNAGAFEYKMGDLQREANIAKSLELKAFYNLFSVAYDRIRVGTGIMNRVTPLPLLWGKDTFPAEFGIVPLNSDDTLKDLVTVAKKNVRELECFENYSLEQVRRFIELPPSPPTVAEDQRLSKADRLAAGEKVLIAVYFFHDSAREQNRRRGKNWEPIKVALYDKLAEVRLARVNHAASLRDWPIVRDLTKKYGELYQRQPRFLEPVLAVRLLEAESLLKSETLADWVRSRELLTEYETRFPGSKNEIAQRVRVALLEKSKKLLNEAQRVIGTNKTEARNILTSVEKLDPDSSSLRSMQQEMKLGYPVLFIGTSRMPEFMSPALARTDSEKQAMQLIFEGLWESIPEEATGSRFTPRLALDRGTVGAGIRDLRLLGNVDWGKPSDLFTAADVAGTLRLMRQKPGLHGTESTSWLDDPGFDPADPGRLRMRFKLGHPDPRSLLTFPILPASKLLEANKTYDDLEFARQPFGSGPFRLAPFRRTPTEEPKEIIFLANSGYSRRPNRMGQPFIKEIRLVDMNQSTDPVADMSADRVHLLLDVPTRDLAKYQANNNLNGKVRTVTVADPHRTYQLAINHRRPGLQSTDLRKGLLHAIDRERVLTDVFRSSTKEFHKAMTGPFPPGSWAEPKPLGSVPPSLYNRDLAATKFRAYVNSPTTTLTKFSLLFPSDDPNARAACERLRSMIESPTKDDERRIEIVLEPMPYRQMMRRLEEEASYDLAYIAQDHPDIWYPQHLSLTLDPTAHGKHGRNIHGYFSPEAKPGAEDAKLAQSLAEVRLHRDYDGKLVGLAHRMHDRFNDAVPYIPLWQLDRHIVLNTMVKLDFEGQTELANPRTLNPTTPFTSIARWRLE